MKDTSKLLPIGSVVLLNNGTKTVMVTGFYSVAANDTDKVYDYCGCLFPEGVISSEQNLLFNHDQIMKVCYMGYTSEEEKEFKNKLGEIINNVSASEQAAPAAEPVAPTPDVQMPAAEPVAPTPEVQMPAAEPVAPAPEVQMPATPVAEPVAETPAADSTETSSDPDVLTISY